MEITCQKKKNDMLTLCGLHKIADISKTTFSTELSWNDIYFGIMINILLKCVTKGSIDSMAASLHEIDMRPIGTKPLLEPMPSLEPHSHVFN